MTGCTLNTRMPMTESCARRRLSPVIWNRCMRVRSLACSVVFAGALAGCAVGPEYFTPDAALPVSFVAPPAGKEPSSGGASPDLWQWWRTLRDPQLNDLIDRAMQNNLDLKIALDRLQQARLQLVVIGGQALPAGQWRGGGGVGTGTDETKGRAAAGADGRGQQPGSQEASTRSAVSMPNGRSIFSARSRAVSRRRSIPPKRSRRRATGSMS